MPADPPMRPSLRSIARMANVSAMTVSRVLRNVGTVSSRKSVQIKRIAAQLGYRPDPTVAKLMHHLRVRCKPAFQASICALTTRSVDEHHPFFDEILRGARQRADELGYGFDLLHVAKGQNSSASLQRILRSRGVEGLLLLPMANTASLAELLDWNEFSVIAATSSVTAPLVRRVTPHHFENMLMLCRELAARGYRRLGLAHPLDHDRRVGHAFAAAINWHSLYEGGALLPPLIYEDFRGDQLVAWFKEHQPEVLIAHSARHCQMISRMISPHVSGRIVITSTYAAPGSAYAGIDELADEIGSTAIGQLAGLVQRGVRGIPVRPTTTMVLGKWVDHRSCPPRARASRNDTSVGQ